VRRDGLRLRPLFPSARTMARFICYPSFLLSVSLTSLDGGHTRDVSASRDEEILMFPRVDTAVKATRITGRASAVVRGRG
jgi:hypothetical protein